MVLLWSVTVHLSLRPRYAVYPYSKEPRAMQILGRLDSSSVQLRLIEARVPAGFPSPAEDYADTTLSLDELVGARAPSVYLVRAAGESMTGAGIFDGDVLIVDRALQAHAGDVVVALVGGAFTVKTLAFQGGQPLLLPANQAFGPILVREADELEIWGVVTHNLHAHRRR